MPGAGAIVELRRRPAPQGVCGRRWAERCQQGSRAEFESRIPDFTPSPLPWHHPCPPGLHSSVAQWTESNRNTRIQLYLSHTTRAIIEVVIPHIVIPKVICEEEEEVGWCVVSPAQGHASPKPWQTGLL